MEQGLPQPAWEAALRHNAEPADQRNSASPPCRIGFRSSFRDWAADRTSTPGEVVEAALAHTVRNPTEAAYARSDLFERRRRLMDDWAAYLSGTHGQVWHDDGNRALRPGVLPTLQPTSR